MAGEIGALLLASIAGGVAVPEATRAGAREGEPAGSRLLNDQALVGLIPIGGKPPANWFSSNTSILFTNSFEF